MARRARSNTTQDQTLSREAVLRFIADNPDRATKRDLAKAFGVKGADRVLLKDILADLQSEGILEGGRKRYTQPGALPTVTVLEIRARDDEGGLLADPVGWDEASLGDRPRFAVSQRDGTAAGIGDRILAQLDFEAPERPLAKVIRVLDRRTARALGVFRAVPGGGGRVEPVERRQTEYAIGPTETRGAKDGDLVEVEPNSAGRAGLPRGSVAEIVGSMSSERAISTIALHAHSIPHVFPRSVLDEAEAAGPATMRDREDWRDLPLVTIDPRDAKDHDDAVHARPDDDPANEGGFVVTVAIADVSWYVRPASRLDAEAKLRGNSVYFPDRVVPMLPERISNDLCSLREGVDRPALAVRMVFDRDGRKLRHRFHRVMMRSHAKLAYGDAQAAIDGTEGHGVSPEITESILRPLYAAYGRMAEARDRRQPLDLDLPERKIVLNAAGRVDRVIVPERLAAHRLIEECMIQANVAAAETLEEMRQRLIYRTHDSPSLAKLESLRDFLRTIEIPLAKAGALRPANFNGILHQVKGTEHESLVNEVVLRSQSQAVYAADNIGHFGLNLSRYAHFTSPIRRYADLIVHRALVLALELGEGALSREDEASLDETAEAISQAERRAMAAERDTVDRLIAHHLAERIGDEFDGRIAGVTKAGLFVQLPAFGADGFVPVSTLGADYYHYDEAGHSLVGERSHRGFRLGDTVLVRLAEAQPLAGSMRFEMLTEPRELPGSTASFHKGRPRFSRGRSRAPSRAKPGGRKGRR